MSQHDLSIANQGFPAFRSDLNDALQALGSMQSGTSAPSTTYANMLWYDTTNNIVKMRNEDNDAWISLFTLDQVGDLVSEISVGKLIGTDTTDASSTTAAAVKTAGGLAVAKKLYVGSDSVLNGLTVGKGAGNVATNTAVGASALNSNVSGAEVTAVGYQALYSNTGSQSTAVGVQALRSNTSGSNAAFGQFALYANTTGTANAAFGGYGGSGNQTMAANTTGSNNTAIGMGALAANTTASNNTAVGYQAGYTNATGTANTFVGGSAGYSSTGTGYNTFVGLNAGYSATGSYNTFIGSGAATGAGAGFYVTSGTKNTIIGGYNGNQGGLDIRTASNYIVLSDGDGNPRGIFDSSGNLLVGKTSTGDFVTGIEMQPAGAILSYRTSGVAAIFGRTDAGETVRFNRATTTVGSISVSTSTTAYNTSSDYRLKNSIEPMTGALNKVAALKPVTYKWNEDGSNGEGFIAHELAEVCPHAVTGGKDAIDEEGNPIYQGIDVSFLVGTLTAAIQELNTKVDAQAAEIAALKGQA